MTSSVSLRNERKVGSTFEKKNPWNSPYQRIEKKNHDIISKYEEKAFDKIHHSFTEISVFLEWKKTASIW